MLRISVVGKNAKRQLLRLNQSEEQAAFKQGKLEASSQYEALFYQEFQKIGLEPIPNYAIRQFNADFGFPECKLAIEIDGGRFHSSDYSVLLADAKKEQALLEDGWVQVRYSMEKKNMFLVPLFVREIKFLREKLLSTILPGIV